MLTENRVLFDETAAWTSKTGAVSILDAMQAAGLNVLVPLVDANRGRSWGRSTVIDPSTNAPLLRDPFVDATNDDPLQYIIDQGKLRGIEIWPLLRYASYTSDPRAADWSKWMCNGIVSTSNHQPVRGKFFDVVNSTEFRNFKRAMWREVMTYDIGGLVLDYIRVVGINDALAPASIVSDILTYDDGTGNIYNADALARVQAYIYPPIDWMIGAVHADLAAAGPKLNRSKALLALCGFPGYVEDWRRHDAIRAINNARCEVVFAQTYLPPYDPALRLALGRTMAGIKDFRRIVPMVNTSAFPTTDLRTTAEVLSHIQAHMSMQRPGRRQIAIYGRMDMTFPDKYLPPELLQAFATGPFSVPATTDWSFV